MSRPRAAAAQCHIFFFSFFFLLSLFFYLKRRQCFCRRADPPVTSCGPPPSAPPLLRCVSGASRLTGVTAEAIGGGGAGGWVGERCGRQRRWLEVMESMHIFKLGSFLISYFQTRHCVFAAAGLHCQLSLSHLQIEIDLPDREPPARGQTLSHAEELPARRVCHLEPRRLFIYSSKDSLMWG